MTKEQTNNWEEQARILFRNKSDCYIDSDCVEQAVSEDRFIELLSQEKEKWNETVNEVIGKCTPLYLEGESKYFTEGQEYTIRQFQKYFNILKK